MSKDPAHTPRRALSPPAVTRFHLRTAPASEAVFVPPFLPPRTEAQRYARKAPPVTYSEFPEPVIRRQPTALPPASRPLELSPPAAPPTEPTPTERTSPGTWREIIARFEAETAADARAQEAAPAAEERAEEQPAAAEEAAPIVDEVAAVEDAPPIVDEVAAAEDAPPIIDESASVEEPAGTLPWEIAAMTTPDYDARRSIHDPEHDSWPVDAEDGDAMPAWDAETPVDDDTAEQPLESADEYEEIGELVLDEVVAAADREEALESAEDSADGAADFPLDAFIVPAGVQNIPTGYDAEHVAQLVAHRLDVLAQELRDGGIGALGNASSVDELSRVLAAIVTGYVARSESR